MEYVKSLNLTNVTRAVEKKKKKEVQATNPQVKRGMRRRARQLKKR